MKLAMPAAYEYIWSWRKKQRICLVSV